MNTQNILVGKWGKIISGKDAGLFICVHDDSAETGGFVIFTGPAMAIEKCWDNWFENLDGVHYYLHHSGWEIEWLNSENIPSK